MRERMEIHAEATVAAHCHPLTLHGRRALGLTLKSQKNCAFLQSTSAQDNMGNNSRGRRGTVRREHLCRHARHRRMYTPTAHTFLCLNTLSDAMENQPNSCRWKNGAKNTIFKERRDTFLLCSSNSRNIEFKRLAGLPVTKTCLESYKEKLA